MKYYISNFNIPDLLFINFQCKSYDKLIVINKSNKDIFNDSIIVYGKKYFLTAIIFMPNALHFTAEIFNLDMNINRLEQGKKYYYDDMSSNGAIILENLLYKEMIKNKIIHLMINKSIIFFNFY